MHVMVEYFGPAREAAGVGSEVFDATSSAQKLIRQIAHQRGGRLATLLLVDGELSRSLVLAVNDQQVSTEEMSELHEGDVVTIIPPVSGGG